MSAPEDFPDLVTPYYETKVRKYRRSHCRDNRSSTLGDDCTRRLYYDRTCPEKQLPMDAGLILIMQEGDLQEQAILQDLRDAGVKILEQQVPLIWRQYAITGHLDAVIVHRDEAIPADCKSMSPHIWSACFRSGPGTYDWSEVQTAFDAKPWLRKYGAQGQLYMLLRNAERFLLICKNKSTGALAVVNCSLDYEYAEHLIQRAEYLNSCVAIGTVPDRIKFDTSICPSCAYYQHCLPDQFGKDPLSFVSSEEAASHFAKREALKEYASVFRQEDTWCKAWAKAQPHDAFLLEGKFLVEKEQTKAGLRVGIEYIGE